jgi:DNA-binding response OmpR family regulator
LEEEPKVKRSLDVKDIDVKRTDVKRILLAEDHEAIATLRTIFLRSEGYEVVCARDGQLAHGLLQTELFHLVVTDSQLPRRSGWEVASLARELGLPVIMSSGWPMRMSPEQVSAWGVDYLFPKPCSFNQLLLLIKKALRKGHRRDRLKKSGEKMVPKAQYRRHG